MKKRYIKNFEKKYNCKVKRVEKVGKTDILFVLCDNRVFQFSMCDIKKNFND